MQVFEQKNSNKMYIYYVYIVKGVFFPFWGIHPMVILWSSYGNPMVWDLYGTEEREARRRGIKSGREENQGRKKERGESREKKGEGRRSVPL